MKTILALDVAKGKSMVSLITNWGEVLIKQYEIRHSKSDFNLDDIYVIMESTGIYHKSVERYFLENNFNVYTINALY